MPIIVYDNALVLTGYAVYDSSAKLLTCGLVDCKKLVKEKNLATRIDAVSSQIWDATRQHYVWQEGRTEVLFEMPVSGANAGGALKQAMVVGALINTITQYGILNFSIPYMHFLNNMKWKKVACGKGNIGKPEYLAYAKSLYPDIEIKTDDVAAAILMGKAYFEDCPLES